MHHRLIQLISRCGNFQILRLIYILLILLALAIVGGAPAQYPTNIHTP
jgi:hypothetical protein